MADSSSPTPTRWAELTGGASGRDYADRIAALAATGKNMHGEASLCTQLIDAPASVLDAGCGTGRIAIRLSELGYQVIGVDLDESMLAQARAARPDLPWHQADLAELNLAEFDIKQTFGLVIAAGNVIPLLASGTLATTMARLAAALDHDGLLVTGFGLDAAHLPAGCPVTELADYDAAATAAGLRLQQRLASWDGEEFPVAGKANYCVSVHSRIKAA